MPRKWRRASKLALVVRRLGLVDACLAMPPTGDEGRDVISAGLVRAVGHELFACLGPPKGGGSNANNLDDATSAAAFAAVERLLPVAVAHARSRDESCALAALPVLAAYVRRLEADESARGSPAAADALGQGGGFVAGLLALGAIRELLGSGSLMGHAVLPEAWPGWVIMALPPGAFFGLAALLAIKNCLADRASAE